jgi:hypothetical protein
MADKIGAFGPITDVVALVKMTGRSGVSWSPWRLITLMMKDVGTNGVFGVSLLLI